MTDACFRLLGSPELFNVKADQSVKLSYSKLILLLAYLTLEHKVHTREALADLFWPALKIEDARANLRRALFNLQQAFSKAGLPKSLIHADRNTVRVSGECIWVDVLEFERGRTSDRASVISRQLALYKGTFLDGIFPAEIELARWVQDRRIQYEQQGVSLLERIIAQAVVAGDLEAVERSCRQLVTMDSTSELAHSSLIDMYMDAGNEAAALKIYETYRQKLQIHLGSDPPATLAARFENITPQQQADLKIAKLLPIERPKRSSSIVTRENRLVAVLHIQIISSVPKEPEVWLQLSSAIVQRLHMLASEYHGTLRQLSSSIVLIYFGYPTANEHSSKLAIDVGLRAHKFISTECDRIDIRSAVHADVMITCSGNILPDLIGECTMIARNLAASVPFGTHLASKEALRGVAAFFNITPANGAPHSAFKVEGKREPLVNILNPDSKPFVGRAQQLRVLDAAWKNVRLTGGENALLVGGVGSGKSRLLGQFLVSSCVQRKEVCLIRFLPEDESLPLRPVLVLIRSCWEISEELTHEIELKLIAILVETGICDHYTVQLLAEILSTQGELRQNISTSQRDRLFSAIAISLRKKREQISLFTLVVEDIHWADTLSLDFISWLRKRDKQLQIFLIVTSRKYPEMLTSYGSPDILIELPPFQPVEAIAVASQHPHFLSVPSSLQHQLLEMADGVPLFIEQILEFALEHSGKIKQFSCPASLRNLFMMKIDQLGDVRQVLCHAACVGRQFSLQILAAIESISVQRCRQLVNKMIAVGLVAKLPEPDQFQFRYWLTREVAFSTLLYAEQQKIHMKIAEFSSRNN